MAKIMPNAKRYLFVETPEVFSGKGYSPYLTARKYNKQFPPTRQWKITERAGLQYQGRLSTSMSSAALLPGKDAPMPRSPGWCRSGQHPCWSVAWDFPF